MITKIYKKLEEKKINFVIFMLILALISSLNIIHKGIIYGDDINFHIHRILAITENLKIGKYVPIYFNYLNGFGYANGLFYPDFFLIIPAILNYAGINIIISLKIFIVIINIFAIYTMYLCVYKISKEKKCAYIGMTLYALSNYRLIVFAQRGALGEMLAFIFIPLVLLGLYEILYGDSKKGYYLTIGLSGLCFSHVISFYLMIFFSILIILINIKCLKQSQRLKSISVNILISVLITSHFCFPMLEQLIKHKFNLSVNSRIFENILPLYLILIDLPLDIFKEYYPAGVGLIYYICLPNIINKVKENKFIHTLMILGILCVLFTCISLIWKINIFYKLVNIIQFPWRLYTFATIFFVICLSTNTTKYINIFLMYTIIIFITNMIIYSMNIYITKPLQDEIMLGEYLPQKLDMDYINNYQNNNIDTIRIKNELNVLITKQTENIEVPLIYYEGYKACDENCYEVYETDNGLVGVKINKDTKNIRIWYEGTKIYNITKYISIIGLLLLIYKIKKGNQ